MSSDRASKLTPARWSWRSSRVMAAAQCRVKAGTFKATLLAATGSVGSRSHQTPPSHGSRKPSCMRVGKIGRAGAAQCMRGQARAWKGGMPPRGWEGIGAGRNRMQGHRLAQRADNHENGTPATQTGPIHPRGSSNAVPRRPAGHGRGPRHHRRSPMRAQGPGTMVQAQQRD